MKGCQSVLYSLFSLMLLSATPAMADNDSPRGVDPRTASQLLHQLESYAEALLQRDSQAATELMSGSKQERIQRKHPTRAMARFIDQDRANLIDALGGEVDSVRGRFSVLKAESRPQAILLYVAFDGRPLGKPLSFVLEGGQYKFDGGNIQSLSGDTYAIKSYSDLSQSIECIYDNKIDVKPWEERGLWCSDEYDICDGSGTLFKYHERNHYCDWNTWGIDFYINPDGSGQCNDRC